MEQILVGFGDIVFCHHFCVVFDSVRNQIQPDPITLRVCETSRESFDRRGDVRREHIPFHENAVRVIVDDHNIRT